ncbi:MAG TPA: hypothetical protein VGE69_02840 [Pseudomonadales bacterium]
MPLPWTQIIKYLPEVATAAKVVWNHWDGKPKPEIDPTASVDRQLDAVAKRIAALEANEKQQAAVVSQIADQLQGIATGLSETAAQQKTALRLSIAAMLLSVGALVVAFIV